jgi:urease accessory protein
MKRLSLAAAVAALAGPALAHTGHGASGFAAGLAHPVFGADHLLAMVAVGLWAALANPRLAWVAPAGFLSGLLLGGLLGFAGATVPGVEFAIVGSVLAFGALAVFRVALAPARAFAAAAAFGAAHGLAHGAELPEGLGWAGYVAGFLIATAALHATGVLGGLAANRSGTGPLGQPAGACVVAAGALLMAG